MLLNCGAREDSWESLGQQGDQTSQLERKSTLNIHWKDQCWSWSSNTLTMWCKEPTHWKRPWCWGRLKAKRRTGHQRMRWLDKISDSVDMNLSKLWEIVKDREAWHAAVHGVMKTPTQLSNSDQISRSVVSNSLRPHVSQHVRPPCPSPASGVHRDSRPSSQWCHPAISSSVVPFSSCSQSLPASESFPMSQPFAWGGQSTGVSALASFLPKT